MLKVVFIGAFAASILFVLFGAMMNMTFSDEIQTEYRRRAERDGHVLEGRLVKYIPIKSEDKTYIGYTATYECIYKNKKITRKIDTEWAPKKQILLYYLDDPEEAQPYGMINAYKPPKNALFTVFLMILFLLVVLVWTRAQSGN